MKLTKVFMIVVVVCLTIALAVGCAPAPAESQAAAEESVEADAVEAEAAGPEAESSDVEEEAAAEADASNYEIFLGAIQPGPEYYYQNQFDSITAAAEPAGMDVTVLLSEYDAGKELSNVEDLIAQGVDAIIMFSVSGDSAQAAAQVCNEADVPLFTVTGTASEGPGVVTCSIKNDFYTMGDACGNWMVDNFDGEAKVVDVQGLLGNDIAESISNGFADAVASRDDIEVVFQQPADWDRAKAISITEDVLASDIDFNVIFVHNEDMAAGVVSVLEEAGVLNNGVQVITQNGSDDGFKMLRAGQIMATCSNSSSYVAGDAVVKIMEFLDGVDIPAVYDSPVFMIDETNMNNEDVVTWDVSWGVQRVEEYLASK